MSDDDDYANAAFEIEMVLDFRGGTPGTCDFCKRPFTPSRYPMPEEGGAWACRECEARWEKEDK